MRRLDGSRRRSRRRSGSERGASGRRGRPPGRRAASRRRSTSMPPAAGRARRRIPPPNRPKACRAATYVGASVTTTTPGSTKSLAARSIPCWEPERTITWEASQRRPVVARPRGDHLAQLRLALAGDRTGRRRPAGRSSRPLGSHASAGRPPASEIMPGRWVAARMSRTSDERRRATRRERRGDYPWHVGVEGVRSTTLTYMTTPPGRKCQYG